MMIVQTIIESLFKWWMDTGGCVDRVITTLHNMQTIKQSLYLNGGHSWGWWSRKQLEDLIVTAQRETERERLEYEKWIKVGGDLLHFLSQLPPNVLISITLLDGTTFLCWGLSPLCAHHT